MRPFLATGEGAGCHVILHDLDAVFILEIDPSYLIKGYHFVNINKCVDEVRRGRRATQITPMKNRKSPRQTTANRSDKIAQNAPM